MQPGEQINCSGLGVAPAILRIKQALLTTDIDTFPVAVMIDETCDSAHLEASLGELQRKVRLIVSSAVEAEKRTRSLAKATSTPNV